MRLVRFEAANVRNLKPLHIIPSIGCNIFWGSNGSGKTSILESIYLLGLGRSFRTHLNSHILQYDREAFSVFGIVENVAGKKVTMGLEKGANTPTLIKLAGETHQSLATLANTLPLQLINADSYQLLNDGPKCRRQFLDWGLFHVEQLFYATWKRYQQALQQRNAALRNNLKNVEITLWNPELITSGALLNQQRYQFVADFTPVFSKLLKKLLPSVDLDVAYLQGWSKDFALEEVLENSLLRDRALAYTQYGPHRADLHLKVGRLLAKDVLSRGQQKLVVSALRLAQGLMLQQHTGKTCVYLIDDLPAELDVERRRLLGTVLQQLQAQVFITSVDLEGIADLVQTQETKMFHVEHGVVMENCRGERSEELAVSQQQLDQQVIGIT
ncbi:DNA replication/repair protein RecF [soil metagenome]